MRLSDRRPIPYPLSLPLFSFSEHATDALLVALKELGALQQTAAARQALLAHQMVETGGAAHQLARSADLEALGRRFARLQFRHRKTPLRFWISDCRLWIWIASGRRPNRKSKIQNRK